VKFEEAVTDAQHACLVGAQLEWHRAFALELREQVRQDELAPCVLGGAAETDPMVRWDLRLCDAPAIANFSAFAPSHQPYAKDVCWYVPLRRCTVARCAAPPPRPNAS